MKGRKNRQNREIKGEERRRKKSTYKSSTGEINSTSTYKRQETIKEKELAKIKNKS